MKAPIFVYEPVDLDVFETVELAERYVEPIDVENGEFVYYDSEGRILTAEIARDVRGIKTTVISDGEEEKYDVRELKRIISEFLGNLGYSRHKLEAMELPDLVQESLKFTTE